MYNEIIDANPYAKPMRCKTPIIRKLDQSQSWRINGYAFSIKPNTKIVTVLQKTFLIRLADGS